MKKYKRWIYDEPFVTLVGDLYALGIHQTLGRDQWGNPKVVLHGIRKVPAGQRSELLARCREFKPQFLEMLME